LVYPFKPYKITSAELNTSPNQFVVLVRPSLLPEIKKIAWKDGIVVYSMWEGYKTKPYSAKFLEYFSDNNFKVIDLHSSGHADEATLVEYANALNPKNIIPIHTFRKNQYQSIFSQNVMVLENNEVVIL
jgi:ribonuclease J